ncbi:type IV secretion protein Rhs [Rodentibacter genomosp. 2]|uniref:type IV secretion protein Rhs n=1 Tax=Rodentibacter genomosp. 2 TaxID=1908266 RepID=UPI001ABFF197
MKLWYPLADVEKQSVKDKQNPKQTKTYYNVQPYLYQQVEHSKDKDLGIYVDDSYLTHGLLFPGVNSYQDQTDEISIFKYKIADYLDPESPHSMEEKETLAPVFKDILKELDLAKEEQGSRFEAGKLKGLLLNPAEQRRLTGIIVQHKSEWARSQSTKFNELIALARKLNDNDAADRIQKRVNDLVIDLKAAGFDSERKAYYMHPLGVIGWLAASQYCCIDIDKFIELYKSKHPDIGWYDKSKVTGKYEKIKLPKLNLPSENNLKRLIKGIIDYYRQSDYEKCNIP